MRIVHLARRYPPQLGGVERHLQGLNKELQKRGHQVTGICECANSVNSDDCTSNDESEMSRICMHSSGSGIQYKLSVWRSIWQQRSILFSADIIHIHDVFWWILPLLPIVFKKCFITFHGYELPGPPNSRQRIWHKSAAFFCRGCIAVGGFHTKWYGINPTQITFGAADTYDAHKEGRQIASSVNRMEASDDARSIVFVGRLDPDLGIMPFLRSLEKIVSDRKAHKQTIAFQADVCGWGSEGPLAKTFVNRRRTPVNIKGMINHPEFYIANADVVVASSYLSILEALTAGKPVISYASNDLKYDYLTIDVPFRSDISIARDEAELEILLVKWLDAGLNVPSRKTIEWARAQNWKKLADQYEALWKLR